MYYIYHIPTFVHKDGSIGKIGCTHQKPKVRVDKQGYSDFEVLETHTCIDTASIREQELQKEYGYPIDTVPYKVSYNNRPKFKKGNKESIIGGKTVTPKQRKHIVKLCRENNKKKMIPILQYDLDGNFVKEWESIRDARRNGFRNVTSALKGVYTQCGGYKWKYKD